MFTHLKVKIHPKTAFTCTFSCDLSHSKYIKYEQLIAEAETQSDNFLNCNVKKKQCLHFIYIFSIRKAAVFCCLTSLECTYVFKYCLLQNDVWHLREV